MEQEQVKEVAVLFRLPDGRVVLNFSEGDGMSIGEMLDVSRDLERMARSYRVAPVPPAHQEEEGVPE